MKTFLEATEDFLKIAKKPQTIKEIYENIVSEIGEHEGNAHYTLSGI